MIVQYTSDIPPEAIKKHIGLLPEDWNVQIDPEPIFFKAWDAPSWICIAAQPEWWNRCVTTSAALYVSAIPDVIDTDTWKRRNRTLKQLRKLSSAVALLGRFINSVKNEARYSTFFEIGLPLQQHDTAHLKLNWTNIEELEQSIALFVHHLPALHALIQRQELVNKVPAGGVMLGLNYDYSMTVSWKDQETAADLSRVLSFVSSF